MDRAWELALTEATLRLCEARTSDLAATTYEVPIDVYTDAGHAERERRLFRALPMLAALSCELREPGQFKAVTLSGTPLLIVRGRDGEARAFLNACRHRGMKLTEGRGAAAKITCPYHAWAYDDRGALVGVPRGPEGFPGLCREERSLVAVASVERHGIVWVRLDGPADEAIDIDGFLGDFGPELARWDIAGWQYHDSRDHRPVANWKLTLEGYCENYHVASLHPQSVALASKAYGSHHVSFGDHQRLIMPNHEIDQLRDIPQDQWAPFGTGKFAFIYHIFPGTIFALFHDNYQVFQIFPGPTADTSVTLQSVFTPTTISEEESASLKQRFAYFHSVVAGEDYAAVQRAQATLETAANKTLVFGRQEIALHQLHRSCTRRIASAAG
jgi:phenylpropionate dioxygenase-like ring-hydroxylating dioxygenase large terminal subunit